jgi:hypothetical protein
MFDWSRTNNDNDDDFFCVWGSFLLRVKRIQVSEDGTQEWWWWAVYDVAKDNLILDTSDNDDHLQIASASIARSLAQNTAINYVVTD